MEFKRTPESRFSALPDFPFQPHYQQVRDGEGGELRMHFLDEGPADAPIVLLLHGQPSWCYLYRFMIPPLVDAGLRVLAPDLIGFGRSDKPTRMEDYTYARHIAWLGEWFNAQALTGVTVFCQDWGSLIGLRLVTAMPERFAHVVLANGGLPAGMIPKAYTQTLRQAYATLPVVTAWELGDRFRDTTRIPGFLYWRKFCAESPSLSIGEVMQASATVPLAQSEIAAYDAPFPDQSYMAGARRFPSLVPVFHDEPEVEENKAAWAELRRFEKPFMTAFADSDPVTAGAQRQFQQEVPGAQGVSHRTIANAGHFLQQEQPQQCVKAILDVMGRAQA